jgi:lysyl-tRNA synthetase class 2
MPDPDAADEREHISRLEEVRAARIEKLERLREMGVDPYPASAVPRWLIADVKTQPPGTAAAPSGPYPITGRIVGLRSHGSITFVDLRDGSGQIQVLFRKDVLQDDYEIVELLDIGDFIAVWGYLFVTRTGELTIGIPDREHPAISASIRPTLLTKALRPLPEKWHGLADRELRVRKRYLTYISDPAEMETLRARSRFLHNVRAFMEAEGFLEVATPVLERVPGGADAEPFVTHHNALDSDFFLRISLELQHKRLIVGGFERIYEIGRVFRNEGLGREHLQEFDLLELYWAYADVHAMKRLVERFYTTVIQETFGTLTLPYGEELLDFTPPWPESDYAELFRNIGVDLREHDTVESLRHALRKLGVTDIDPGAGRGRLIDTIYKRAVRPTLIRPQFLVNHPVDISPLAKRDPADATRVERFQVLMAGSEVGNGFSELNDPLDQRARFEEQQSLRAAGDREAQMLDEEFLEALEYGMPPTAGFGVSIERWLMYLMNKPTIRDVVAFPLTRPSADS